MQLFYGQVRFLASVCYATLLWSGQISSLCMFGNSTMVRSDFWPLYVWQLIYAQVRFLASMFGNSPMVRSDFWTPYVWQLLNCQFRSVASVCMYGNSSMARSDFWPLYVWKLLYGQVRFLASVFGNSSVVRSDFWPLYVWQLLYSQIKCSVNMHSTSEYYLTSTVQVAHKSICYMLLLYMYGYLDNVFWSYNKSTMIFSIVFLGM